METTLQDQLRVPKQSITVDLALRGQRIRRVELYFVPRGDGTSSSQELIDLLLQDREFLPAEDVIEGQLFLFAAKKVLWISMPPSTGSDRDVEWLDRRRTARVELEDGTVLEGEILYAAPADNARVLDHLNNPDEPYLRVRRQGSVALVNKSCILRVCEQAFTASKRD